MAGFEHPVAQRRLRQALDTAARRIGQHPEIGDASTVFSAALTPGGIPRRALEAARARGIIVLSEVVFQEIGGVLARPKFARVVSEDRRREILAFRIAAALWIEPEQAVHDCRDVKDNRYLELALAAHATAIVSGDEGLLVLDPWRDVRGLRPAEFLKAF